jgi:hypothetical protein
MGIDLDEVRREAAARVAARRTPTVRQSRMLHFGGVQSAEFTAEIPATADAYLPPQDVSEWIDEILTLHGYGQWTPCSEALVGALEAGRTDRKQAAAVLVTGARKLGQAERYQLWRALGGIRSSGNLPPEARHLMRALMDAYEGMRGAVTERPEPPEPPDPPRPERIVYRSPLGQPAGVLPWMGAA